MVTHGGVQKGELLLMITKMTCSRGGLNHPDETILGRGGQQGMLGQKLIPQNPDQTHNLRLRELPVFGSKNGLFRRVVGKELLNVDLCGGDRPVGLG